MERKYQFIISKVNVESLIPERLYKAIDEIRLKAIELLKNLPREDVELKKWLD